MRVETGGVCAEIFYALVAEDMGDMQAGRVFVVSFRVDEARYGALHFKELRSPNFAGGCTVRTLLNRS